MHSHINEGRRGMWDYIQENVRMKIVFTFTNVTDEKEGRVGGGGGCIKLT